MASSTQRASASYSRTYDVFLSFRGQDTRKTFTGHLHKALKGKKIIKVFKDDIHIETGSTIRSELLTAIEESRFAIIVISQHYANSKWCLIELVKILECMEERNKVECMEERNTVECMEERNTVIPIFYNVDPNDVINQTGTFGEAFKKHAEDGIPSKELQGWKTALTTLGGKAGKSLGNYQSETVCIEEIVHELYNKLVCAGCNGRVDDGRNCLGAVWHQGCLRCKGCNRPFTTELEFKECVEQPYGPYHKRCYDIQFKLCNVCKETIPVNSDGQVVYLEHLFWRQRYCPSHATDGTLRCCSCERLKPKDTTYYQLDDDRKLCPQCKESIINTDKACRSICLEVRKFYKKLNVKVKKIPVQLVSRQAIVDKMKDGNYGSDHQLPVTRTLCLFEERTVTSALMGRPSQICFDVKEILIWYGLPRILTGSLLAQQMMSAWLRLNRYDNLSPDVEKGICRYLANRWLEHSINSDSSKKLSEFEKKLCKFRKHKIELDGNALPIAKKAVGQHGLGATLETIRKTGKFPSVSL